MELPPRTSPRWTFDACERLAVHRIRSIPVQFRRLKTVTIGTVMVLATALLAGCTINGQVVATESSSAPSPAALRSKIGVAAGSSLIWERDDALRQRALKAIADTGAHWVTMDLDWNGINGASPTTWRWSQIDRFVSESRSYGLAIIAVAAYSPPWAVPASCPAGDTHCLPASPEPFATFVRAAAQRYGSLSIIPELRNTITRVADLERAQPRSVRPARRRCRRLHHAAEACVRRDQGSGPVEHGHHRCDRTGAGRPVRS